MKNFDRSLLELNDLEAPGWEETKHPLLSLLLVSLVGYGLVAFLKIRSIVEALLHLPK